MKNPVYLVTLSGGGDTYITLVKKHVWDWIISDYPSDKGHCTEKIPDDVMAEKKTSYATDTISLSRNSYENDRALNAPGKSFQSVKELGKYLKEHDLTIEEEFEGYSY
jgi:hypothetical protein